MHGMASRPAQWLGPVETGQGRFFVDPADQFVGRSIAQTRSYGLDDLRLAQQFCTAETDALVVGAHIGAIAVPLSKICRSLVAIEANPATFKLLQANVELNGCTNVTCLELAANDKKETIEFLLNTHNSGGSKRRPVHEDDGYFYDKPEIVSVDARPLDDVLDRTFDVVFMDIEGSETFAFRGMQRILSAAKILIVEFFPHHLSRVAGVTVEQFLEPLLAHFQTLVIPNRRPVKRERFLATLQGLFDRGECCSSILFARDRDFTYQSNGALQAAELVRLAADRYAAGDRCNERELLKGAVASDVDCADAYQHLAIIAASEQKFDTAAAIVRRAIAINPGDGRLWNNLGNYLRRGAKYQEALAAYETAQKLLPHDWRVLHGLGQVNFCTGNPHDTIRYYEAALALHEDKWIRSDLAYAVLKAGELRRGFALHKVRHALVPGMSAIWDSGLPQWEGQDLSGKTLIVQAEQGYGDVINFVRFIPEIKKGFGNPNVIFAAHGPMVTLLAGQCGIDQVFDINDPRALMRHVRKADYHAPLFDAFACLGYEFDTLPKPPARYLKAPHPSSRDYRMGAALAVGVVWRAGYATEYGDEKSVPLANMLDLAVPGVRLWSLQMGPASAELAKTGADVLIADAMTGVSDFAQSAAIFERMDVVVSVCSAPAHLAAALGRPVLWLKPFHECWRWCRGASPWYSSVELFGQAKPLDWAEPIAQVKARIAAMV